MIQLIDFKENVYLYWLGPQRYKIVIEATRAGFKSRIYYANNKLQAYILFADAYKAEANRRNFI